MTDKRTLVKSKPWKMTHGKSKTPLYKKWKSIKYRCLNPNCKDYPNYGGRGITLYEPWINNFELFEDYVLNNLGPLQKGYTLERINNEQGYEPGNIEWAKRKPQSRNRRNIVLSIELAAEIREAKKTCTFKELQALYPHINKSTLGNVIYKDNWK